MSQLQIDFDRSASIQNRDAAIQRVEQHADNAWLDVAMKALRTVAACKPTFTSDDVWAEIDRQSFATTHEHRAMGSVMVAGRKLGIIVPTDRFISTTKASQHRQPIRVWKSLVFQEN